MTDLNHLPNEKKLIDFYLKRIAVYLDKHPEQELVSYVHVVDGEYRHEVELREKKLGEWRKRTMIGEMIKFRKLLDENGIEWHDASSPADDPLRIDRTHFEYNKFHYSVIHGYGTYGGYSFFRDKDEELLELMSNAIDGGEPVGWLTADEAMQIILARDTV